MYSTGNNIGENEALNKDKQSPTLEDKFKEMTLEQTEETKEETTEISV